MPMKAPSFRIITFNAALLRLSFGPWVAFEPVPYVSERLRFLCHRVRDLDSDVVVLQEVFGGQTQRLVAEQASPSYPYSLLDDRSSAMGSGLMVLSRHPMSDTMQLTFRSNPFLARAIVAFGAQRVAVHVPGQRPTVVVNTHLTAGLLSGPESRSVNAQRARQIDELAELAVRRPRFGGLEVIAGDFNAGPDASRSNYMRIVEAGFTDAYTSADKRCGDQTVTWSTENVLAARGPHATSPPQRVDHVFYAAGGPFRADMAEIVFVDDRVPLSDGSAVPMSDHYGLHVQFSSADDAGADSVPAD